MKDLLFIGLLFGLHILQKNFLVKHFIGCYLLKLKAIFIP